MYMKAAKNTLMMGSGAALSVFGVLRADDMIWNQFRRNIIFPFQVLVSAQAIKREDLEDLGKGSSNFVRQFRPLAFQKVNVKDLMIDDHDYSTPQDHYFAYVNKRTGGYSLEDDKSANQEIMEKLRLDEFLDPTKKNMIFGLNETLIQKQRVDGLQKPKHSKKEYASIEKLGVGGVFNLNQTETKKVEFDDEKMSYRDMVKINDKKIKFKQKKLKQKQKKQKELQQILQTPSLIDSKEKAIELYDSQPIKASELSNKDINRLEMLKNKATQNIEESGEEVVVLAQERDEAQKDNSEPEVQKTKIKLDYKQVSESDIFPHQIAYDRMEEEGRFDEKEPNQLEVDQYNRSIELQEKARNKKLNKPTLTQMMQKKPDTRNIKNYAQQQVGQTTEQRSQFDNRD